MVTGWKRGPDSPFGVVTVWCGHCLVWSLSGVITVWCGHCLVCSEVSHFNPSAPTSNQAPVLCRMENEKGWAQLGVQIDITQKETDKCSFLRGWGGGGRNLQCLRIPFRRHRYTHTIVTSCYRGWVWILNPAYDNYTIKATECLPFITLHLDYSHYMLHVYLCIYKL